MFANISWPQLLIILVIVLAIFGTKRLRTLGSDLGSAVKGFRKSMQEEPGGDTDKSDEAPAQKSAADDGAAGTAETRDSLEK